MFEQLTMVALTLGFATMLGIVATVLNRAGREHVMWFALTLTTGLGFMLSLLMLAQVAR
jgi:hypothetical protein